MLQKQRLVQPSHSPTVISSHSDVVVFLVCYSWGKKSPKYQNASSQAVIWAGHPCGLTSPRIHHHLLSFGFTRQSLFSLSSFLPATWLICLAYSTWTLVRPVKQQGLLCICQPHVRVGGSDFLALSFQTVCQSMEDIWQFRLSCSICKERWWGCCVGFLCTSFRIWQSGASVALLR